MFVVLVRPATVTSKNAVLHDAAPPLGVAYLAASLLEANHQVQVVDALGEALDQYTSVTEVPMALQHGLTNKEIVARIPEEVDLIGISCMFSVEWPFTRKLIDMIRQRFPEVPIVVGGEHVTATAEYILKDCAAVDYCALGEGEELIVDLANALEKGEAAGAITGIVYRKDGNAVRTEPRNRIRKVGDIPPPAWNLVPIEAYLDAGIMFGVNLGRSMPILASRGCPYECTFCSNPVMWGRLWRARPPQDVITEMMHYMEKYDVTNFDFYDLTAIIRKQWIVELAALIIENNLDITWQLPSGTRSEAIDSEVTELLYTSGCRYMNYAPESGSEEMLKNIKKRIVKERMLDSMRAAVKNKLSVKTNIILGFPGESYRHVLETFGFIIQIALTGVDDLSVFPFSPYPGSEITNNLIEQGVIELNDDYFHGLAQYADIGKTVSHSEYISDRMLIVLLIAGMGLFYATSYLVRPIRIVRLVKHLWQRKPETKLEVVLDRMIEKRYINAGMEAQK